MLSRKKKSDRVAATEPPLHDSADTSGTSDSVQSSENVPHKRVPLIAGNWKMNLDHLQAIATVQKLSWSLADAQHDYEQVEVAVLPPFTDLRSVQTLLSADKMDIQLGAQDLSPHESGAYTGDVSGAFLAKLDVAYVLVGHSERREHHDETSDLVAQKALAAVKSGMVPIVCVGETERDTEQDDVSSVPLEQLAAVLSVLPHEANYVVAYEPVWAIGSGSAATPEYANTMATSLRTVIADQRNAEESKVTRILYGGSVSSQNVASFMREPEVDGVLVGGASLQAEEFSRIAQYRKHVTA